VDSVLIKTLQLNNKYEIGIYYVNKMDFTVNKLQPTVQIFGTNPNTIPKASVSLKNLIGCFCSYNSLVCNQINTEKISYFLQKNFYRQQLTFAIKTVVIER